jgi:HSP20 family protein
MQEVVATTLFNLDPFEPLVSQMTRPPAFMPVADVAVSDGDLVLTMDVPGLTEDDLSIELADGYLVVRGERKMPAMSDDVNLAHRERSFGKFERRLKVPDGIDAEAITASMDHGVLSLIVPKPERMKPKTISIASSSGSERRELETAAG